jgi:uncharacterized protein (DUF2252 family)
VGVTEEYGEVSASGAVRRPRESRSPVAPNGRRYQSAAERAATGKRARKAAPRSSHARWEPSAGRRDPIELLERQAESRIGELVPIRHGRMLLSPFSYFRGAALQMASDLAATPISGLGVQLCGDAHLSNFGIFGSPERRLVFDINDFDETAFGPWEWDVKRLAASLEVAGRESGFSTADRSRIVRRAVRSYRTAMREFSSMSMLEVWYQHLDLDDLLPRFRSLLDRKKTPSVWRAIAKARAHDHLQAFDKLARVVDGECRIVSAPPLIVPVEEIMVGVDAVVVSETLQTLIGSYQRTLLPNQQHLLGQYRLAHLARKVVGVGSVGTDAWILLLLDGRGSPLFLQVKEAEASVLEEFASKSEFSNHGQRVVVGQRLIQEASDIFLGWDRFRWRGGERDFYIRQLKDWKGSVDVAGMTAAGMALWGQMCGWTLARAHARTGDRLAIAAYLGGSDAVDRAISAFAVAYAEQNDRDYRALSEAVASGRLTAHTGL